MLDEEARQCSIGDIMNRCSQRYSQRTLNRVEKNDETLKELRIGDFGGVNNDGVYFSRDGNYDFSRLGASIGENTHLASLNINIADVCTINKKDFFQGLKRNTSIHELQLVCQNHSIVGGVIHEILKAYQENNNLTSLGIVRADLQNGGGNVIASTLTRFTNLTRIFLLDSGITDQLLLQIVDAIRGHPSLDSLSLRTNRIGNVGCETLANLLSDPISNLLHLDLGSNAINSEGAAALANGLANNTKMKLLCLAGITIDRSVKDVFSKLLCNTSSINNTYSSNHTLEHLMLHRSRGDELRFLLKQNRCTTKVMNNKKF